MTGSRVAAFFDVDHTLLSVNSGMRWARHQRRAGELSLFQMARSVVWLFRYRLSLLDLEGVIAKVALNYAGASVATAEAELRRWFTAELIPFIRPAGREQVLRHIEAGHIVAILSSGTRYSIEPLAEHLGIPHVLCTEFEERDGVLTGHHVAPACAGTGKVIHAERFAAANDIDLAQSFFYTDSYSDLPMLARVGVPRIVSPDRRLRRYAGAHGWQIMEWETA